MTRIPIKAGDRVAVDDPALAEMQRIMREATGQEPAPNNEGVVSTIEDDWVLIDFDDGGCAPYPRADVRPIG